MYLRYIALMFLFLGIQYQAKSENISIDGIYEGSFKFTSFRPKDLKIFKTIVTIKKIENLSDFQVNIRFDDNIHIAFSLQKKRKCFGIEKIQNNGDNFFKKNELLIIGLIFDSLIPETIQSQNIKKVPLSSLYGYPGFDKDPFIAKFVNKKMELRNEITLGAMGMGPEGGKDSWGFKKDICFAFQKDNYSLIKIYSTLNLANSKKYQNGNFEYLLKRINKKPGEK